MLEVFQLVFYYILDYIFINLDAKVEKQGNIDQICIGVFNVRNMFKQYTQIF